MTHISDPTPMARSEVERNVLLIVYVLYGLAFFMFVTAIAAVIVNHVKLRDCGDGVALTHHRWLLRTFWFGLLWFFVCTVLVPFVVGVLGYAVLWIWCVYRIARGALAYAEHRPLPGRTH